MPLIEEVPGLRGTKVWNVNRKFAGDDCRGRDCMSSMTAPRSRPAWPARRCAAPARTCARYAPGHVDTASPWKRLPSDRPLRRRGSRRDRSDRSAGGLQRSRIGRRSRPSATRSARRRQTTTSASWCSPEPAIAPSRPAPTSTSRKRSSPGRMTTGTGWAASSRPSSRSRTAPSPSSRGSTAWSWAAATS